MSREIRCLCLDLRGGQARPMEPPRRSVLCLGNFDGVHVAHAALLREGVALSRRMAAECGVLCFFRPSMDYFSADGGRGMHLTSLSAKLARFAEVGVDFVCLLYFPEVRGLSPRQFLSLLTHRVGCVGAVCGFNHRFGKEAAGDASLLQDHFGAEAVRILPEMVMNGETVCATRIRECLWHGKTEEAAALLGRPYSLTATVTGGKRLGRTMGFPTANQYFPAKALIPAHGVYAALCSTPEGIFPGVANVGCRPTVDGRDARVNCETYILGYTGDLYGVCMRTEFLFHLRGEQTFDSLCELTAAIRRDAAAAETYLRERGYFPAD